MYPRLEDNLFIFQLRFTTRKPSRIILPKINDMILPSRTPRSAEIVGNTIYLTFNRPEVDNCHRGILCTNPSTPNNLVSGILFHVEYDTETDPSKNYFTEHARSGRWSFRERPSRNPAAAQSLLYLQKIGEIDPRKHGEVLDGIREALKGVPVGRENREAVLGKLREGEGNEVLEGYDCVVWTVDALRVLDQRGIVRLGKDPTVFMAEARQSAWPGDIAELVAQSSGR